MGYRAIPTANISFNNTFASYVGAPTTNISTNFVFTNATWPHQTCPTTNYFTPGTGLMWMEACSNNINCGVVCLAYPIAPVSGSTAGGGYQFWTSAYSYMLLCANAIYPAAFQGWYTDAAHSNIMSVEPTLYLYPSDFAAGCYNYDYLYAYFL